MSGRVTLTARERICRQAIDRAELLSLDDERVRGVSDGVAIRTAPHGRYRDSFGDIWVRHRASGGAVAMGSSGPVVWPESELADADDTYGPFVRQSAGGGA